VHWDELPHVVRAPGLLEVQPCVLLQPRPRWTRKLVEAGVKGIMDVPWYRVQRGNSRALEQLLLSPLRSRFSGAAVIRKGRFRTGP